jgi:hypothetical protein
VPVHLNAGALLMGNEKIIRVAPATPIRAYFAAVIEMPAGY